MISRRGSRTDHRQHRPRRSGEIDIIRSLTIIGAVAFSLFASVAFAQQSSTTRIRGIVEKVEGATLTVRAGEAGEQQVKFADDVQVFAIAKGSLADVKPGGFIGVGAMPQPDGSQKAIQVTVFAESLRGIGEGFRPWDRPGSTMTNATIDDTVASVDGQVVMVRYKDGEKKIIITPEAVIRTYVVSDKSELKVGSAVAGSAMKKPDGSFELARISVGRDGIAPQILHVLTAGIAESGS